MFNDTNMAYVASKFDPETDPDRPQLGEIVVIEDDNGQSEQYVIMKISYRSVYEMMTLPEPDKDGFDQIACRLHAGRPAVVWLCFCNKIKDLT